MKIFKKVAGAILSVLILAIIAFLIWMRFGPSGVFPQLGNSDSIFAETICMFPAKVVGESMEPLVEENTQLSFSKCFEKENLTENTIILYMDGQIMKVSVIREVIDNGTAYKVSQEASQTEVVEIQPNDVLAVYYPE